MRSLPLALLCLALAGPARAYERQSVDGKPGLYLFWQNRNISYVVHRAGSADVSLQETLGAIKRATFAWSSPSCTDLRLSFGGLETAQRTNLTIAESEPPDKKNLFVWHEDHWPPPDATDKTITKDMAAVTTVIYDATTGVIIDADIDLNGYNFFWTTFDDGTKAATDIEATIAHELGHVLGLAHSPEPEATMFANTSQGELKKRTLESDDVAGICFIYPFDTVTPQGGGQGTVKVDVQGGCALGGRPSPVAVAPLALLFLLARRGYPRRRHEARRDPPRTALHLRGREGAPREGERAQVG
jgi:hypothetical protein